MEHLLSHLKDLGPWALTAVCSVLAWLLRKATKAIESLEVTQFKADEAHEEVSQRVPEYARRYATWKAHR